MIESWRDEIKSSLKAFHNVIALARAALSPEQVEVVYQGAPHESPTRLPPGKMAVYGYWGDGVWLKIGLVGPKSLARYTSQHYRVNSTRSTLARSLAFDPRMSKCPGFDRSMPGVWMRSSCHRVSILIPKECGREVLALLEAFLHVRLKPRYER